MRRGLVAVALCLAPGAALATATGPGLEALTARLERLAAEARGTAGVCVEHVETGARACVSGDAAVPMMSVFKLPIVLQVLHRVDRGEVSLDAPRRVRASDLRPGVRPLGGAWRGAPLDVPVRELVRLAIAESDNTASDLLLGLAGGPAAVTARLRALGLEGVRVDRPYKRIALDSNGIAIEPPDSTWSLAEFERLRAAVPAARRNAAQRAVLDDPRDTATAAGLADLLVRLQRGELLSPESTRFLLDVMARTATGPRRIRAGLPPGTPVAHKTGTSGTTDGITLAVNDVGLVTLPEGRGTLAVVVLVKGARRPVADIEAVMARLARAAWEHWSAGAPPGR
jgi:beta-lactamase class A